MIGIYGIFEDVALQVSEIIRFFDLLRTDSELPHTSMSAHFGYERTLCGEGSGLRTIALLLAASPRWSRLYHRKSGRRNTS